MPQQVMSEAAQVAEFEKLIDRLTLIVETENRALEEGNIHALQSLQQEKGKLSFYFQRKWMAYRDPLKKKGGARAEAFVALSDKIDDLKDLMAQNMVLLNAAKVNSATRIEAGMQAWKRHHNTEAPAYGADGHADPYRTGPSATTSHLI